MKRVIIITACLLALGMVALVVHRAVRMNGQRHKVAIELSQRLRDAGAAPRVVLRKSKLDSDDWKYKMWFQVPDDPRIVDAFWCDGAFSYTVFRDGVPTRLNDNELKAFLAGTQSGPQSRASQEMSQQ